MHHFVESLESRRFLSTVTLAAAEASLATDVKTLADDAGQAKTSLLDSASAFVADLKALPLKSGPLKSGLHNAVASARTKIGADVSRIIKAGFKDGQAVISDVLHITIFDSGNATKIAADQKHLASAIKTLQTLETPLVGKLTADVSNAITQIDGRVQAIIAANPTDSTLQAGWATLSNAYQSAQQTLTSDLTHVLSDLETLSTAS